MEFGATEVVGFDDLAERGLHDRGAAEIDAADAFDHDHFVAEGRHVRAACRAAPEDDRELREAHRR